MKYLLSIICSIYCINPGLRFLILFHDNSFQVTDKDIVAERLDCVNSIISSVLGYDNDSIKVTRKNIVYIFKKNIHFNLSVRLDEDDAFYRAYNNPIFEPSLIDVCEA